MRRLFLVLFAPFLLLATPSHAEKRIALVIGNTDYQHADKLNNAVNDANRIARELKLANFELITRMDAGLAAMTDAMDEFVGRLKASKGSVGVLYYAGHGVQSDNRNYLVPVDASGRDKSDLFPVDLTRFEELGTRASIIILDACRNDPFPKSRDFGASGGIAQGRGLARVEVPKRSPMLIAYATRPGDVATDGSGSNGPYAAALAEFMQVEGLPILSMFMQVRERVLTATNNKQTPWESSSLVEDFYFRGGPAANKDVACTEEPGPYRVVDVKLNDVLNVRRGASSRFPIVATITPDGTGISKQECQGNWCRVRHQCREGWVLKDYIKLGARVAEFERDVGMDSQGLFRVVEVKPGDKLNIRADANANAELRGAIPHTATDVNVGECNGETKIEKRWCVVSYLGVVGWARASYLLKMDYDETHPE